MTRRSKRKSVASKATKKQSVAEEVDAAAEEEVQESPSATQSDTEEQETEDSSPSLEKQGHSEETNDSSNEDPHPADPESTEPVDVDMNCEAEREETGQIPEGTSESRQSDNDKADSEPDVASFSADAPVQQDNSKDIQLEQTALAVEDEVLSSASNNALKDNASLEEVKSVSETQDDKKEVVCVDVEEKEPANTEEKNTVSDENDDPVSDKIEHSKMPEDAAMDVCEEDKTTATIEDDKSSNNSAVIEIGSPEDSQTSEKEPVVIELAASDEFNDDVSSKNSPQSRHSDAYQVLDEIDLTKSDEEEMDVGAQESSKPKIEYIVPDYDDPSVTELEIDPEEDSGAKIEETKDFLKYWHPVQDNPQEFTSWTYLLQFVEQDGNLPLARRAFNSFFCRYPLCYGYWKKFSELERKNGNLLRAQKILERGVRAIPLSIDLWVHVVDFYMTHYSRPDAGVDKTRKIFDRAIAAAGLEFRSEKLWNKYVKWEIDNKNWLAVMAIYEKAVLAQTQHYSIIFSDFKTFVNKRSPRELISEEEFQELLMEVRTEAKLAAGKKDDKKDDDCEIVGSKNEEMDDAPPGVDDAEKPVTDEEIKAIRQQIINKKKKIYDETEQLVTKIWAFEEGIKRPYFHVKQLERAQLKNWREYLDVEIGREDHERIVLLFERCLIACALYEDFWLKYTKYMAKHDAETTSKIFERACTIHLPKKPNIHIQWAAHEEVQGNVDKATKVLENLDNVLPGMAMIRMRRVALARRTNRMDAAEELLKSYVACAAKDKEEIFYTRKLSWFLLKVCDKKEEAKKLLKDLIPKYKSEIKLYNDLVEMEFQCAGVGYPASVIEEGMAMEAFNLALTSDKLTDDQKFVFSQRKLEFLEDFGLDVKHLQKVYDEHQKLARSHKKRNQIDLTSDETPSKKQKTETTAIAVVGTSQLANGASYTTATSTQPVAYASGDPSLYYQQQQQQQNYWNYTTKPADAQTQYNYSQQWSQYYGSQR